MIVDGWALTFLGTIAVATLVMAVVQVGVIVYASRLAKKVDRLTDQVEHDIKPLLARVNAIGDNVKTISENAVQVSSLAVAQLERADRLFADVAARIEQTLKMLKALTAAREGVALIAGLRAAFSAFRSLRQSPRRSGVTAEDEEALFIG